MTGNNRNKVIRAMLQDISQAQQGKEKPTPLSQADRIAEVQRLIQDRDKTLNQPTLADPSIILTKKRAPNLSQLIIRGTINQQLLEMPSATFNKTQESSAEMKPTTNPGYRNVTPLLRPRQPQHNKH
jgi:hypothetical protein